eukprot:TRINITY_DN27337_c0_g1_i1.p1 TRINITY_DN27337_c0_g1~~TRINITY_DN27337_c0_g1_i1.p1  ORF type:complete len:311 (+),score=98.50 TRINITY_DN27337_c0_g1_i1:73-1005(+)
MASGSLLPGDFAFDAAARAAYGAQLRAWTDSQVDSRMSQLLRGVDLGALRQEASSALAGASALGSEVRSLRDSQRGLMQMLQQHEQALQELRQEVKVLLTHHSSVSEKELELVRAEALHALKREVGVMVEKVVVQRLDKRSLVSGAMEVGLETRLDVTRQQLETRLGELRRDLDGQLADMRNEVLTMVRQELTAAFRTEAKAVTAMDQQIRRGLGEAALRKAPAQLESLLEPGQKMVAIGIGGNSASSSASVVVDLWRQLDANGGSSSLTPRGGEMSGSVRTVLREVTDMAELGSAAMDGLRVERQELRS